ncbi:CDP-diacylglycerol-glycerol-3-phosphate 3-phosphatidyltransferase [Micractinium conductrix]|uniref:CDP-diacylglycerol-glycerol-3-phosphate 3-phosphatidyltransferase n=1 Tax=Micractinium conductrix TaxID=554055 RepID=A0A2P6V6J8_9CHLO|nr:CDP-diacylglycerol-glycerol-3-phosphate 3-phosphatidyltransferase [Micractinium conductrix]|eukprot:PSC69713.1 CDP-diacylglycerol-glycerol-3-phosphate 3-phosphatidyltransferase [Micractinium conductrix]
MVATRSSNGTAEIKRVPLFRVSTQESLDSPIDRRSDYYRRSALAQQGVAGRKPQPQPLMTLPNICTFARVALVPVFVLLWHTVHEYASIATASVFILAALTDWLDGYLARRMKITSAFGAFLDPVADKIMYAGVSTALVLLATAPPAPISSFGMAVPVCLMISREITMSALREWAASSGGSAHKAVKVNSLGKWKTALQMVAMSLLLVLRNADHLLGGEPWVLTWIHDLTWVSFMSLWVATALAVWSLFNYMSNVWHYFRYPGAPQH